MDAVIHLAGNGLELADLVVLGGRFASTLGLEPDQFCNRGLDQQGLDANAIMRGPANDLLDDLDTRVARAISTSPCRARTSSRMCRMP